MAERERLVAKIQALVEADPKVPPVIDLDEYFTGNDDQWCIAPNQWEYGRPELSEFYARFKAIRQRDDVQLILVGIHDDWVMSIDEPDWPAAENIHIYTTATEVEVNSWITGLESDGAGEGWPYGCHAQAPEPEKGFRVMTVYWN